MFMNKQVLFVQNKCKNNLNYASTMCICNHVAYLCGIKYAMQHDTKDAAVHSNNIHISYPT